MPNSKKHHFTIRCTLILSIYINIYFLKKKVPFSKQHKNCVIEPCSNTNWDNLLFLHINVIGKDRNRNKCSIYLLISYWLKRIYIVQLCKWVQYIFKFFLKIFLKIVKIEFNFRSNVFLNIFFNFYKSKIKLVS